MGLACAYEAATPLDAAILSSVLSQAGIEASVFGQSLSGGVGELPAQGLVRVMVQRADLQEALEIVHQWQQQAPDEAALRHEAENEAENTVRPGRQTPAPRDPTAHWPEWAFFVLAVLLGALLLRLLY